MTSKIKVDNIADQDDNNIINESGDVITVGAAGDTVAVAGNIVKSNAYQASDGGSIISQSGTTITIGASGDTVSLASGASQSGFGRSGSVDWQTGSIKTATFTAASGEGYFCNTSGGAFTVNLPAGTAGAIVAVADYTRTFASNSLTISPNGTQKIGGVAGDIILNVNGQALTLVYVDDTEGWINVQNAEDTEAAADFITATGGTVTTSGNCKIHTFTGPGTFEITVLGASANNKLGYMVVAGGGGSGGNRFHIQGGGGGGAGGFREGRDNPVTPYTASPLVAAALCASVASFPITVGAGGTAGGGGGGPGGPVPEGANAGSGSNSIFSTITSAGGGFGGNPRCQGPAQPEGQPGGSGGGGGGGSPARAGGTGNTPPTSPAQGQDGAPGSTANQTLGGSGGGATGAGATSPGPSPPPSASSGGTGATTHITGSPVVYSTGGTYSSYNPGTLDPSCAGAANTGDGGDATNAGPGSNNPASTASNYTGKAGGSGIVIIRYKYQ